MSHGNLPPKRYRMVYRFYRRPTFISGFSSLFDLYNAKPRQKIYLSYSDDFKAMVNDFKATGLDLQKSIDNYASKNDIVDRKKNLEYSN